ncbi:MAG: hypothetical protein PVG08_05220 [Desulfobacterales bacterium]|jgi:hypothetical protein
MAFFSDDIDIKTGIGRRLSRTPEASIKTAVRQAKAGISSPAKICLAFPDGYNKSFDPVLKILNSELGNDCLNGLGIVAKVQGSAQCCRWLYQSSANLFLSYPFTFLLLRALIHEFARVLRAIIHKAVISKKLPDPSVNYG